MFINTATFRNKFDGEVLEKTILKKEHKNSSLKLSRKLEPISENTTRSSQGLLFETLREGDELQWASTRAYIHFEEERGTAK